MFEIIPEKLEAGLYLIPTPIGNLDDITLRALKTLASVDILACEDTRHTGQLLKKFGINVKRVESYFEHNEQVKSEYLAGQILQGKSVGLASDAGTPGISDPGYRIIKTAIDNNIKIVPLPGATAFVPALISSGFAVNEFKFVGFLPHKKGRQTALKNIEKEECTVILYESTYRIQKLISEMNEFFDKSRNICIAREISKVFEEFLRGSIEEMILKVSDNKNLKGEFVVVVEGKKSKKESPKSED